MNLESDAGGLVSSIPARDLGGRNVTRGVGRLIANRQSGTVEQGASHFERNGNFCQVVLHCLELSDDLAELLALLRVFGGDFEQRLAETLQLCGGSEGTHVESCGEVGGAQRFAGGNLVELAGEIHRCLGFARDAE